MGVGVWSTGGVAGRGRGCDSKPGAGWCPGGGSAGRVTAGPWRPGSGSGGAGRTRAPGHSPVLHAGVSQGTCPPTCGPRTGARRETDGCQLAAACQGRLDTAHAASVLQQPETAFKIPVELPSSRPPTLCRPRGRPALQHPAGSFRVHPATRPAPRPDRARRSASPARQQHLPSPTTPSPASLPTTSPPPRGPDHQQPSLISGSPNISGDRIPPERAGEPDFGPVPGTTPSEDRPGAGSGPHSPPGGFGPQAPTATTGAPSRLRPGTDSTRMTCTAPGKPVGAQ